MDQIEDVIKERENHADDLSIRSSDGEDVEMVDASAPQPAAKSRRGTMGKLEKRQIEQRIEEDRERHKRERESIWAIPTGEDTEMNKLWEETSDFGEDDDRLLAEESEDFLKEMEMQRCNHQKPANGNMR